MNTIVNIIVPLWNRGEHIKLLLENLKVAVNATNEKQIKLWISDFHSSDIDLPEYIKQYTSVFPIEIVLLPGPFIIGKALQIAAEKIPGANGLIYFTDADIVLPNEIFNRIRNSVIRGKTFYAPVVSRENEHGVVEESVNQGGKGCIGVHILDFLKSKGWRYPNHVGCGVEGKGSPMTRTAWGKHDTHIYQVLKVLQRLKPVRLSETDQWVRFHKRDGWYLEYEKAYFARQKK